MRLSGLSLVMVLLSASVAFAQHGGGGGGSSGGSSGGASSGGGSHSSAGGSSSSGGSGGHSSAAGGASHSSSSGSHNSGSHGGHGSSAAGVTRTPSSVSTAIREPNGTPAAKSVPEKRTFSSFLRHPFRKPQPKTIVAAHSPVCVKGPCRICPVGKTGRGCVVTTAVYAHNECRYPEVWSGGRCGAPMMVLDPCSALLREMQRQADRMQAARTAEQNACLQSQLQACSEAAAARQSEEGGYQMALGRYRRCISGSALNHASSGAVLLRQRSGLAESPFWVE